MPLVDYKLSGTNKFFTLAIETKISCKNFLDMAGIEGVSNSKTDYYLKKVATSCVNIPSMELAKIYSDKFFQNEVAQATQTHNIGLFLSSDSNRSMENYRERIKNCNSILLASGATLATVAFMGFVMSYREWKRLDWEEVNLKKRAIRANNQLDSLIKNSEIKLNKDFALKMKEKKFFLGRNLSYDDILAVDYLLKENSSKDSRFFINTIEEMDNQKLKSELLEILDLEANALTDSKILRVHQKLNPNGIDYDKSSEFLQAKKLKSDSFEIGEQILSWRSAKLQNQHVLDSLHNVSTKKFSTSLIVGSVAIILSTIAIGSASLALSKNDVHTPELIFLNDLGEIKDKILDTGGRQSKSDLLCSPNPSVTE